MTQLILEPILLPFLTNNKLPSKRKLNRTDLKWLLDIKPSL